MCGNYGQQKQQRMAHGSLTVAGMIVKSESSGRSGAAGSSSPSSATATAAAAHNSAKMGSRRIFTPQFKLQVLDSYRNDGDCKGNQRATARKYGIHRRQIQKWLQVENNLRSVVANGGGSSSSSSSNSNNSSTTHASAGSGSSSGVTSHGSTGGSSGASMKINLLNHHHHHPAHYVHPSHHHLHYQPMHHHHGPGLTGLMQAPSVAAAAAAAAAAAHYHHHQHQHHMQQQPVHPLAFHPIAVPSVQQQQLGLDTVRQRVARNGASATAGLLSPVTSDAIPVSSCSPLSVASSSSGAHSASSLCSASPNSMVRRSPPSSSSSSHQLLQFGDPAPSGGDTVNPTHHHQQQQQSVIFSPVPLLATAAATSPSASGGANDTHYYGHIRAVAAAAAQAAAAAATAHRYDHPIDLSRPGSQSAGSPCPPTPYEHRPDNANPIRYDRTVKQEQVECDEEEISVEEVDEERPGALEQAWDLSCRRSGTITTLPERKRSASAMSGPAVTPDTSRPPKSVKLFKPYLLDEEDEREDKITSCPKQHRPDSALADDDKDSTRESPAIVERPLSPVLGGRPLHHQQHPQQQQQQYPIIWSATSPAYYEQHAYELTPPAYLLAAQSSQTVVSGVGAPVGTALPSGRGWSSPQASPVSGYDSSTSISSVCSGPEEDNTSHSSGSSSHSSSHGSQSEKLKQQAIDSFYHDVACRGDYRAVATKYNINRKYVEKWLQQEQQEDDHHHHHHHADVIATPSSGPLVGPVRSPLVVG